MIALFGGTFNPVHNGHIALAREVAQYFALNRVEFLPCYLPVHRENPDTSPDMRKQMVDLAIGDYPELVLNTSEIDRAGPSYAVDTLSAIKQQYPDTTLCWLMGSDSYNSFPVWKDPLGILSLANLIVCQRPDVVNDENIFPEHRLKDLRTLREYESGKIAFYPMQPNNCSSTEIRVQIKNGDPANACLSAPVLEFIQRNHLYR